jgi:opacity protein-like surface antigen
MRISPLLFTPLLLGIATSMYASPYSLSLSADTTRFDYAETAEGRLLDTETNDFGDISGFTLSLEPSHQGLYITTSYSSGNTDYIGGTNLSPDYGSHRTTTDNTVLDYSAGYKIITVLDQYGEVEMPFKIELGYREWQRNIQATSTVSGLDETYDWGYFDIGIGLHFALSPVTSLGIDASYRNAFSARMYDMYGNTFNLNNVYGYKVTVPLEVALSDSLNLFFQYNYEYWNIGSSDTVGGLYEPDSETKNQTLSAGLKFWF